MLLLNRVDVCLLGFHRGKMALYARLGVKPNADANDIARSYRRLALQYHPDRNPEGGDVFKELTKAYEVLSDPDRRAAYDATGATGESSTHLSNEAQDKQHAAQLGEEIRAFYDTYRGSPEERNDVAASYTAAKGSFEDMLFEHLLFDNREGEVLRLREVVLSLLQAGTVTETKKWSRTGASEKQCKKFQLELDAERKEAKKTLSEMGVRGVDATTSLQVMLADRAKEQAAKWESMADNLLAKYGGGADTSRKAARSKSDDGKSHRAAGKKK